MPSNAREYHTPAAVKPGRKAKNDGTTAKSLNAIGGLLKKAGTPDKARVESSGSGVSQPSVVRLFTEPHANKQKKPKPEPSQKAAQGKGNKAKTTPPKAEDTAAPDEVKIVIPYECEVKTSIPLGGSPESDKRTNRLNDSELGFCIICDTPMKYSAYGSWSVPEAYLDKDGKLSRNEEGEVINLKKDADPVKGFTCSKGCDEKMEKSRRYLG